MMDISIGKLKINGAALFVFAAAFFFDLGSMLLISAIAGVVHETGHFAALKIFRQRIIEVRLDVWGFTMRCSGGMPYTKEIIAAAAGPLASLLLAFAASYFGRFADCQNAYMISGVSLIFCVFNILPVQPLDGGRIVYAASAMSLGLETAGRVECIVNCAVIFILLVAGAYLLIITKVNFTLLLAAVWLLIGYCKKSGISIKSRKIMSDVRYG